METPMTELDLHLLVRQLMAAIFVVVGVSHAAHPNLWRRVFLDLGRVEYAPFVIAIATLPIGLVTVLCHNDWTVQPALMITLFGWGMTIKSVVYALFPSTYGRIASATIAQPTPGEIRAFRIGALAIAAISAWILIDSL